MTIADQLKWALKKRMVLARIDTAQDLAERAGIDPRKAVLTKGTTFDTLLKIADALGCRVSDLVAEVGES